jgi:hypothetical protein
MQNQPGRSATYILKCRVATIIGENWRAKNVRRQLVPIRSFEAVVLAKGR